MPSLSSNFILLVVPISNSLSFYPLFLCKFIHKLMILKLLSALFLSPLLLCFAKQKSESTKILFKGDDNTLFCTISSLFNVRGFNSVLSPSCLHAHKLLNCLVACLASLPPVLKHTCYNVPLSVKWWCPSKQASS